MTFNYVSLFSGIGGFEQALNKLGGTCVLASEIDKFANQAYEALYGEPTAGDITQIEAKDVPDHDVLVGGFPCQAFSVAGKRGGFEDARGTLFFEVARIAAEKQPKMLLLENVKGLVGHDKGRTLDTIVQTLNDIGYTVDFNVLNSKYFGVPQNRERIFIVGVRDDLVTPQPWIIEGNTVVPKGKRRISVYEGVKTFNFDWPSQESVTTRLRDVLEPIVDEKYYLSEEKTAQLEARPGDILATLTPDRIEKRQNGRRFKDNDEPAFTVNTQDRHGVTIAEPQMLGHIDLKGHDAIKRVYSAEGVAPTLTTMGGGHREPKIAELQQFSDGPGISYNIDANYTKGTAPGDVGKGRRTHVIEDVQALLESDIRKIITKSRSNEEIGITFKENGDIRPHRMDARKSGISELNINHEDNPSFTVTSAHAPKVYGEHTRYRIRKLTPLECFRLQGFPDWAHQTLVDAGLSDSQRYKQAGNAVTVNVIEAIGRRLIPLISRTDNAIAAT